MCEEEEEESEWEKREGRVTQKNLLIKFQSQQN